MYNLNGDKMKEYLKNYIEEIEKELEDNHKFTDKEKEIFKDKIQYFQHERLIHLLVTLFYALFFLGFIFLCIIFPVFAIPCIGSFIFLIFYVKHYFFLENSVQYLYKLYDKIFKN